MPDAAPPPAKLRVRGAWRSGRILHLFGASCVTYGKNPMALDNETVCNDLGEIRTIVGWTAFGLAILFMPVAFITAAVGGVAGEEATIALSVALA